MIRPAEVDAAIEELARSGFLAPVAEAAELAAASANGDELLALVERRVTGEPLAWITGTTTFCGETIQVSSGVYCPRPQTQRMAEHAAQLLPDGGIAVDLCTGSGAVARVLAKRRPRARVIGTDVDPAAVACARRNGIEAYEGDLGEPLPEELCGTVDVVTVVAPYVPTDQLRFLPRDVQVHEPRSALDGGEGGIAVLTRAVEAGARLLRPGGWLLLEVGGDQADALTPLLDRLGSDEVTTTADPEGDVRSVKARFPHRT